MKPKINRLFFMLLIFISTLSFGADQSDVRSFFAKHRIGSSPDYAVVKDGIAGPDLLLVVTGYMDDKSACEGIIEPLNKDPSLSVVQGVYQCVPLNDSTTESK